VAINTMTLGITNHHLWQLLASGKIRKLGRSDEVGLVRSMRLDIKEVLAAATGVEDPLNYKEVAALIGVNIGSVGNLVLNGLLMTVAVPEHMSSKLTLVFPRRDVDRFCAEFVSRKAVRAMIPSGQSLGNLRRMGLEPAIELEAQSEQYAKTTFFRRSDFEATLDQIRSRTA
jgi:hypothetical protein